MASTAMTTKWEGHHHVFYTFFTEYWEWSGDRIIGGVTKKKPTGNDLRRLRKLVRKEYLKLYSEQQEWLANGKG